ncbi:MAG: lysophospholipid acyltransferase family protein [Bacteroidetes bacterium]|nr:lysophospholipid acyltransferase family protein [Bacteroidota bacterium]
MTYISRFILWLMGWKISGSIPADVKRCVIIAAPHTSNWDFFIGRLAYFQLHVPVKFLIKKEVFIWPFGSILKSIGGIAVDRGRKNNLVEDVAKLFTDYEVLNVIITPEGTRRRVDHWKKGFYYIALKAGVPLVLGFVDYGNKTTGFGDVFYPTGNLKEDMAFIEEFYMTKTAKYPAMFNLSPENLKMRSQQPS